MKFMVIDLTSNLGLNVMGKIVYSDTMMIVIVGLLKCAVSKYDALCTVCVKIYTLDDWQRSMLQDDGADADGLKNQILTRGAENVCRSRT